MARTKRSIFNGNDNDQNPRPLQRRRVTFRDLGLSSVSSVSSDTTSLFSNDSTDLPVREVVYDLCSETSSETEEAYISDFVRESESSFLDGLIKCLDDEANPFQEFSREFSAVNPRVLLQRDDEAQARLYRLRRLKADIADVVRQFNQVIIIDGPGIEEENQEYYRALNSDGYDERIGQSATEE